MTSSDLEQRLERMYAGYANLPVDTGASWRRFIRLRRHAAIQRRAVGAGAAVVATFGYQRGSPNPAIGIKHPDHPAHVGRIAITARIAVPGAGSAPGDEGMAGVVVGHGDQVWAITYSDQLIKIDPATNRITLRRHVTGSPTWRRVPARSGCSPRQPSRAISCCELTR